MQEKDCEMYQNGNGAFLFSWNVNKSSKAVKGIQGEKGFQHTKEKG